MISPAQSTLLRQGITALAFLACLMASGHQIAQAQTESNQILSATDRLETTGKSLKLSGDAAQKCVTQLEEVRSIVNSGYVYLGLYRLQPCWEDLLTSKYVIEKKEVEKGGAVEFEKEWQRLGVELTRTEKLLESRPGNHVPSAVSALIQISQSQVRPYYQAGRLYGLNTTLADGLYYLGLAPANLDFVLFARQLRFSRLKTPRKFSSLATKLAQLESETLQSYRTPGASGRQSEYNAVNSRLKMASELNSALMFEGALLKYLEATLYLGLINAPSAQAGDSSEIDGLRTKGKALARQLQTGVVDDSIGELYLELAQHLLDRGPDSGDLKRAHVIIHKVIPAYLQYVTEMNQ
jgi:hypothetical protein